MKVISSSRNVIKEWNPEIVRSFIAPPPKSPPMVRQVEQPTLDFPYEKTPARLGGTPEEEDLFAQEGDTPEDGSEAAKELEEARRQAEEMVEEARKEAERLREEARQEGFAQGLEEGRQEGRAQAAKELSQALDQQKQVVRQELSQALEGMEHAKDRCLRNYLEQLKDCSIAVAEKVIHTSLEASGDIIKRMIIFETEKLKKTAWVKIYMEKLDYDMMMQADGNLVTELAKVSDNIKFVVMEKEQRGSCIIETPEEIMDIGVETQMENIRDIVGTIRA